MIRIILLSNKPIVLEGLRNALKVDADIQVAAEAKTVADMLRLVETHQPDIVVMDAVLPDADFMNVIRDMLAKPNPPEILIFSLDGRTEVILKAFQIGVRGYLLYCEDFSLVVEAVRTIAAGDRWSSPEVQRRLAQAVLRSSASEPHTTPSLSDLSEREQEVLALLAQGKSNKEMATALRISEHTVRTHLRNIYAKLNIETRGQMIAWAAQHLSRDDELA